MTIVHPDYSILAARIAVSNLHKETTDSFVQTITDLRNYVDNTGRDAPLIAEDVYKICVENREKLEAAIDYTRDFNYDFFGFKTGYSRGRVCTVVDEFDPVQIPALAGCGSPPFVGVVADDDAFDANFQAFELEA